MGLYGLKHLIEKVTAVASTTQCPPHCKDQQSLRSRIDILISVFISSRLHLLPKHFEQAFFYVIFFTHIHLMSETFIINDKSHCCNNTFANSPSHRCWLKHLRRIQIIFMLLESAFPKLFCVIFSQKLVTFL